MSQIFKDLTAGPVPPTVATSYPTDVNSPAVPIANVLNVKGGETTTNNVNGIQTDGSFPSNTITVQLTNRISVTASTSDGGGQTQNVTLFTPTNATAFTYSGYFTGIDTGSGDACGGYLVGLARKTGGIVVIIGDTDAFDDSDASLVTADWDIDNSGADLIAVFVGVAGRTIDWRCTFVYQQVS